MAGSTCTTPAMSSGYGPTWCRTRSPPWDHPTRLYGGATPRAPSRAWSRDATCSGVATCPSHADSPTVLRSHAMTGARPAIPDGKSPPFDGRPPSALEHDHRLSGLAFRDALGPDAHREPIDLDHPRGSSVPGRVGQHQEEGDDEENRGRGGSVHRSVRSSGGGSRQSGRRRIARTTRELLNRARVQRPAAPPDLLWPPPPRPEGIAQASAGPSCPGSTGPRIAGSMEPSVVPSHTGVPPGRLHAQSPSPHPGGGSMPGRPAFSPAPAAHERPHRRVRRESPNPPGVPG